MAVVYTTATATADVVNADGDFANFATADNETKIVTNISGNDMFFTTVDGTNTYYRMTSVGLFKCTDENYSTLEAFVVGTGGGKTSIDSMTYDALANTQPLLVVSDKTVEDNDTFFTLSKADTAGTTYVLVNSDSAAAINKLYGTVNNDSTNGYTVTSDTDLYATATGNVTVNGNEYSDASTTDTITIKTSGTTSTLYAGTVTIGAGKEVTATDNVAISVPETATATSITATATAGTFTSIGDINNDETFKYNGKDYVMTNAGLYNSTGKALVTTGYDNGTYTLSGAVESPTIVITDKELDLTAVPADGDYIIVDATTPTAKYGTVTVADSCKTFTFASENLTSDIVETVKVNPDTTITTNFATQVLKDAGTTSGVLTVNGKPYNAATVDGNTSSLIIDAAADGTTSTLRVGLVTLNTTYPTVTGTDGNVVTVTSGELSVLGFFPLSSTLTLRDISNADAFKVNGKDYIMTTAGLFADTTNGKLWTNNDTPVTGGVAVSDLTTGPNWTQMVPTASTDTLALDTAATALESSTPVAVVDSLTDPQKDYGRVTVSDGVYTVNKTSDTNLLTSITLGTANNVKTDFDTNVTAAASTTPTINGKSFSVTAAATFTAKADGTTATLNSGTVALDPTNYKTVTDTSTSKTITCTGGDGITFDAGTDTIGGLNKGDVFEVAGTEYRMTDLPALVKDGAMWQNGTPTSVTLTDLADTDKWGGIVKPTLRFRPKVWITTAQLSSTTMKPHVTAR